MTDKAISKIICTNCGGAVVDLFQFKAPGKRDSEVFSSCSITGLHMECPYCGHIVGCNKNNMIFDERNGEGRVFHEEGEETF